MTGQTIKLTLSNLFSPPDLKIVYFHSNYFLKTFFTSTVQCVGRCFGTVWRNHVVHFHDTLLRPSVLIPVLQMWTPMNFFIANVVVWVILKACNL